jgi:hypothetical protein
MALLNKTGWELAAAITAFAAASGAAIWLMYRKRPSPEEVELARRTFLVQSGRLVDGTLLDICDMPAAEGRSVKMLMFSYRIGGVDYECSQEITALGGVVNTELVRAGFPCSVRYQPGNPQNSIVVAEGWSGLREGLPKLPKYKDPEPIDRGHLRKKAK